jgi:hypothetical protein
VAVITYVNVSILSPVLVIVCVIGPEPVAVEPLILPVLLLVHVKIAPVTSLVGVKFNWSPLQMVDVYGVEVNTGVGLTRTVLVVTLGAHVFAFAVNVYTTSWAVLFVLLKVSVIVPLAAAVVGNVPLPVTPDG